jgi:hypothetical protein
MTTKRLAIPSPPSGHPDLREFLGAIKSRIELLTGPQSDKLTPLPNNAALPDVITALNKVIARLS